MDERVSRVLRNHRDPESGLFFIWKEAGGRWLRRMEKSRDPLRIYPDERFVQPILEHLLQRTLDEYPEGFLFKHFWAVVLAKQTGVEGYPLAGRAMRKMIVVGPVDEDQYSDLSCEITFHHEVAHLVLWAGNYRELLREWETYSGDIEWVSCKTFFEMKEDEYPCDDSLFASGFLAPYCMSSPEEDFCECAQHLMMDGQELWAWSEDYPLIKAKLNLVADFYQTAHPHFTRDFFRNMPRHPYLVEGQTYHPWS